MFSEFSSFNFCQFNTLVSNRMYLEFKNVLNCLINALITTYLIADLKISFFESFLSIGCVGTNFLSSAKAPETFCCLQRSRVLVKIFLTTTPFRITIGEFIWFAKTRLEFAKVEVLQKPLFMLLKTIEMNLMKLLSIRNILYISNQFHCSTKFHLLHRLS